MTPRHFNAIWKHYLAAEERRDNRTIMLAVSIYNAFGAKKQDGSPITAADFKGKKEEELPYGDIAAVCRARSSQTTDDRLVAMKIFATEWKVLNGGKSNG